MTINLSMAIVCMNRRTKTWNGSEEINSNSSFGFRELNGTCSDAKKVIYGIITSSTALDNELYTYIICFRSSFRGALSDVFYICFLLLISLSSFYHNSSTSPLTYISFFLFDPLFKYISRFHANSDKIPWALLLGFQDSSQFMHIRCKTHQLVASAKVKQEKNCFANSLIYKLNNDSPNKTTASQLNSLFF